jgi:hypothetical protein
MAGSGSGSMFGFDTVSVSVWEVTFPCRSNARTVSV